MWGILVRAWRPLPEPFWAVCSLNAEFRFRNIKKESPSLARLKLSLPGPESQGLERVPCANPDGGHLHFGHVFSDSSRREKSCDEFLQSIQIEFTLRSTSRH